MTNALARAGQASTTDFNRSPAPRGAADRIRAYSKTTPLLLVAAAVLWLTSVGISSNQKVADYGLLGLVSPLFVVGLALVCVACSIELARDCRAPVLSVSIVLLVLMLNATVPMLASIPEYAWTFKHVGVIEFFKQGHGVQDAKDIYQQWPALFTSVAAISDLVGVSPLKLAGWAPVFFSLWQCVPMFAIFRTLSSDRRIPFLAVFLFQSCIWVGTSYLSPQAMAFQLSLGFFLVLVTWLRRTPRERRTGFALLGRVRRWVSRGAEAPPEVSRRARVLAVGALYLLFFAIVAVHQLTPYILLSSLACGMFFGLFRPRSVFVGCAILVGIYLAPRLSYVNSAYGLLGSLRFWDNATGVVATTTGIHAQVLTSQVSTVLALVVWLGALLSVIRSRRQMGRVLLPALLAVAPFLILFGQSYGGEAIYRVFLFSLPWCAFLMADAICRLEWRRGIFTSLLSIFLAVTSVCTIQGLHGTLSWSTFSSREVNAITYFYAHAHQGSVVVLGAANWPGRSTANYDRFGFPNAGGDPDILTSGGLLGKRLGQRTVATLDRYMATQGKDPYLIVSKSMIEYAHYYGLVPDGSLQSLDAALQHASGWTVFSRNADAVIYQYTG